MDPASENAEPYDDPPSSVRLQRPPLWSFEFLTLAAVGGVLLFHFAASVLPAAIEEAAAPEGRFMFGVALLMLVPLALVVRRLWAQRRPLPPIRFYPEFMELPKSVHDTQARRVAYRDILSLYVGGPPHAMRVLLESRRYIFQFHQSAFVEADGPEQLVREMRRRILALGEGRRILETMAERQSLAGRALSRRPFFTQLLLGMLVVFALNQDWLGGFEAPFGPLRWGALSAALVRDGELFRLLSASFLHAGWIHLGINAIALWSLGGLMERVLGAYRYVLLYLLAGLGGTIASAAFGAVVSVGASGAIFGLLGGLAVLNWRYRTQLPLGIRQPLRWWVFILGLNALLPVILPMIDVWAHVGGFVAGAGVAALLLKRHPQIRVSPPAGPGLRVLTLALAAMYAVGLGTAVWYAAEHGPEVNVSFARRIADDSSDPRLLTMVALYAPQLLGPEDVPLLERITETPDVHPHALNTIAFSIATADDLQPEHLAIAEKAARRAVDEQPVGGIQDTLATVLYRRGEYDEAIRIERRVLEAAQEEDWGIFEADENNQNTPPFYASQLQRFLWKRLSRTGPLISPGVALASVSVRAEPGREDPAVVVELNEPFEHGLTLYAIVMRNNEPAALFQLLLGPRPSRRYAFDVPAGVSLEGVRLEPALLAPGSSLPPAESRWDLWPMHPVVARFP